MARNGKAKSKRRSRPKPSISGIVESVLYANLFTGLFFDNNVVGFVVDEAGAPGESLRGILENPRDSFDRIAGNLSGTDAAAKAVDVALKSAGLALTFRLVNWATRRAKSKFTSETTRMFGKNALPVRL